MSRLIDPDDAPSRAELERDAEEQERREARVRARYAATPEAAAARLKALEEGAPF